LRPLTYRSAPKVVSKYFELITRLEQTRELKAILYEKDPTEIRRAALDKAAFQIQRHKERWLNTKLSYEDAFKEY
jgi:hypothetical protein